MTSARLKLAAAALVGAFVIFPRAARAEEPEVRLGVGTQKLLTVPGLQRVAVGDPSVVDLKVLGSHQLLLIGAGAGSTTIIVWNEDGKPTTYRVRARADDGCWIGEIRKLVGDTDNVHVRMIGDRIFLDGIARTSEELVRVHQITTLYPNVQSLVTASPKLSRATEQIIAAALEAHGFRDIHVSVIGSTLFLDGTVDSEEERLKAEKLTEALIPG